MKLKIKSDFYDWYDHAFDLEGRDFVRLCTGGLDRIEMFRMLSDKGLTLPRHGLVKDLAKELIDLCAQTIKVPGFIDFLDVVVYTDLRAHRGEGKIKLSLPKALELHPECFASEWIPPAGCATSFRYLQVGKRKWWLRYSSENDWRSNNGDVTVDILGEEEVGYHPRFDVPLFAVDFLLGQKLYAIDFNIAPGLDPIRAQVSAKEIVSLLKEATEHFKL